jgi:CrcB protein
MRTGKRRSATVIMSRGFPGAWHTCIFVMVGMCGGYTTFSSFSLETLNLVRNGEWLAAGSYVLASAIFCLVGVWLGHIAGVLINR